MSIRSLIGDTEFPPASPPLDAGLCRPMCSCVKKWESPLNHNVSRFSEDIMRPKEQGVCNNWLVSRTYLKSSEFLSQSPLLITAL